MTRSRRHNRFSTHSDASSSASTSPERGIDDDNDSFMQQANDSQSSLALSVSPDEATDEARREIEERCRVSPICRLPAELMIQIFNKLSSPVDLKNCMLVSKDWARNSVGILWHRPQTNKWQSLKIVAATVFKANGYFDYANFVKRLNLSGLTSEVSDGTLDAFVKCKRVERLTLTNCSSLSDLSVVRMIEGNRSLLALDVTGIQGVTDQTMLAVARNCLRLQGLNITSCRKITDEALEAVAKCCKYLKRLKFNNCTQLTDKSIIEFAINCPHILEIDLHGCAQLENEAVTTLIQEGKHLRELRLPHCVRITDEAFLNLPRGLRFESLRILDLTDCGELQDRGVQKIVEAAPRLRNLVLAKCRLLTDNAIRSITALGKNLHYIHLGHCARITDAGVQLLISKCNRIRYIDLACCSNLTDASVIQLATLPKLKRIGLVKCTNITDRSILQLAKQKPASQGSALGPSSLERVHLSYCINLTLSGIHALLNNCPRLTHLSLTGVQAFLREDLVVFCREAPPEFNDHQREVFCVFSGPGVGRLRNYLNQDQAGMAATPGFDATAMYDDLDPAEGADTGVDGDREDDMDDVDDGDLIQLNVGATPSPAGAGTPVFVNVPQATQFHLNGSLPQPTLLHVPAGTAPTANPRPQHHNIPPIISGGGVAAQGAEQVTDMMADVEMQDRNDRGEGSVPGPSSAPTGSGWSWSMVGSSGAGVGSSSSSSAAPPLAFAGVSLTSGPQSRSANASPAGQSSSSTLGHHGTEPQSGNGHR